jgi:hypothetical protein
MSKKGNYQIPFDKDGNQLTYPEDFGRSAVAEWMDNVVFYDTLEFQRFLRGRSAAHCEFKRLSGQKVIMFLRDFEDVIPEMFAGRIHARWTYCKRGQNYGIRLADPDEA